MHIICVSSPQRNAGYTHRISDLYLTRSDKYVDVVQAGIPNLGTFLNSSLKVRCAKPAGFQALKL